MPGKLLPMIVVICMALGGLQGKMGDSAAKSLRPFEVRVTKPPRWKGSCLQVSIDRVNRSESSLYLPAMGLVIASSATSVVSGKLKWFTVYGATDILDTSAAPLPAGMTQHNDYCVGPTFAVVDVKNKTRRQVPIRGKLRVYASYFLSERDWRTNQSQIEDSLGVPPDKWQGKVLRPGEVTITVSIPCRELTCNPDCDEPPLVQGNETEVIPDTLSDAHDWNNRGKAITEELERKMFPCVTP